MSGKTLHYKLLYRWLDRDIEITDPKERKKKSEKQRPFTLKPLTRDQRDLYFDRIKDALNPERGLLATLPTESLGGHGESGLEVAMPCICFTQISLTSAETHCHRYGRLGFGFTKRAVLQLGGRPVAYIRGGKTDPNVKRLIKLRKWLEKEEAPPGLLLDFDYLRHFYKRIQFPYPQRDPASKRKPIKAPSKSADHLKGMAYTKPKPLDYAEEQEWRIVLQYPERFGGFAKVTGSRWIPVEPGNQLQVLVVPDNVIYQWVLSDKRLMEKVIAPEHRKPVQVISWESICRI